MHRGEGAEPLGWAESADPPLAESPPSFNPGGTP